MKRMCLLLTVVLLGMPATLQADENVYRNVLPSVVWLQVHLSEHQDSYGTGVVVDSVRNWILTNAHVVRENQKVSVIFPQKINGRVIAEREFYRKNMDNLTVPGKIILLDKTKDLAIIQVKTIPPQARAILLAPAVVTPGQSLHAIGNPGKMGALWVYTSGHVRQTYRKKWRARTNTGKTMALQAQVVETNVAINPGDSGGPVVNDKGELVAIVSSYDHDAELVSTCIALSEIQKMLANVKPSSDSTVKQDSGKIHKSLYTPTRLPEYLPDVRSVEKSK